MIDYTLCVSFTDDRLIAIGKKKKNRKVKAEIINEWTAFIEEQLKAAEWLEINSCLYVQINKIQIKSWLSLQFRDENVQ